jgi:hypothetical protein
MACYFELSCSQETTHPFQVVWRKRCPLCSYRFDLNILALIHDQVCEPPQETLRFITRGVSLGGTNEAGIAERLPSQLLYTASPLLAIAMIRPHGQPW